MIPQIGKGPEFLGRERFPLVTLALALPLLKRVFRPEELDRRSREDHVLIPRAEGNQDVNDGGGGNDLALVNL